MNLDMVENKTYEFNMLWQEEYCLPAPLDTPLMTNNGSVGTEGWLSEHAVSPCLLSLEQSFLGDMSAEGQGYAGLLSLRAHSLHHWDRQHTGCQNDPSI